MGKLVSDSMASAKIKRMKIMCIINDNVVWGRLSKNYSTRKFIARNICDAKYSQFMVVTTCFVHVCNIAVYTVVSRASAYFRVSAQVLIFVTQMESAHSQVSAQAGFL